MQLMSIESEILPFKSLTTCEHPKNIKKQNQIEAIVYTRRQGTLDLTAKLSGTGILILEVTQNLPSKTKHKNQRLLCEIYQVHANTDIDLRLVNTLIKNGTNLQKLIKKKRLEKKKPNKRQKHRTKKKSNKQS